MSWQSVDPEAQTLGQPVRDWLHDRYRKTIKINEAIESTLPWRPTMHFEINAFSVIAADVRVTPFPESLQLTKLNITNAHLPITIYSICSEEAFLTRDGQREARELKAHGLGLFTVNADRAVTLQFNGIPLIQHIPLAEFNAMLRGIPPAITSRIKDAFDSYNNKPSDGVTAISDVIEALVYNAISKAIRKGWMKASARRLNLAKALDEMHKTTEFDDCRAAIGGARSFVKEYRNTANHSARNKKQAYDKHLKGKRGFSTGIQVIESFYRAMKTVGLTVKAQ